MASQTRRCVRLVEKMTFLETEVDDSPAMSVLRRQCQSSPCLFGGLDSEAESTTCGDSDVDELMQTFPDTDDEYQQSFLSMDDKVRQSFPKIVDDTEQQMRRALRSATGKRRGFPLKHHCHFPVAIEQDVRFNVVRRLLGAEAGNTWSITRANHGSKVQIKGRGASLRESSDEPLVIVVSTPSKPKLERVADAVEALLRSVHEQYATFCREEGSPAPLLHVARLPGEPFELL